MVINNNFVVEGPGFVLAVGLALLHAFAPKFNISAIVSEQRWISFGGGVSIGYVFLEIFPELSQAQEEIEDVGIPLIGYLEHHVYLLALLGLLVFYGLDIWALSSRKINQARYKLDYADETMFWIHIGFFWGNKCNFWLSPAKFSRT